MGFAKFMASPTGRGIRIVAGLILIAIGWFAMSGVGGWIVAIIGVVPILAGVMDWCLIAPLLGAPFQGKDVRTD
jgi:hypothetical protein